MPTVMKTPLHVRRSGALLVALVTAGGGVLAGAATPVGARVGQPVTQTTALITIDASGAALKRSGPKTELVLSGVAPDATVKAQNQPSTAISTIGAVKLIDSRKSVEAVVRSATGGPDSEGVRLADVSYNANTQTATGSAAPDPKANTAPGQPPTRFDQRLPAGPVIVTATDPAVAVDGSGAAQPPRGSSSSSSYNVPVEINNRGDVSDTTFGVFVPSASTCVTANDFKLKFTTRSANEYKEAGTFAVDTSLGCFGKIAVAAYDVSTGFGDQVKDGPIRLTVTQSGPRFFISACTDKFPIKSRCSVLFAPIKPTVRLHV